MEPGETVVWNATTRGVCLSGWGDWTLFIPVNRDTGVARDGLSQEGRAAVRAKGGGRTERWGVAGRPMEDVALRGCGTLGRELTWPPSLRGCSGRRAPQPGKQTELSVRTAGQHRTADWGPGQGRR